MSNDNDYKSIPKTEHLLCVEAHWKKLEKGKGRPLTDTEKAWNIPMHCSGGWSKKAMEDWIK